MGTMRLRHYYLACVGLLVVGCGPALESGSEPKIAEIIDLDHVEESGLEVVDGFLIEEGDVIVGEVKEQLNDDGSFSAMGVRYQMNPWPGNSIPYTISSDFSSSEKSYIKSKIANWNNKTGNNLRILPARKTDRDYVYIIKGDGCYSYLNRIGGRQPLSLGTNCLRDGTIEHEFGHAAGLHHEQNRCDRDNYVKIHWDNIESGKEHNFDRECSGYRDTGSYDWMSVMHYTSYHFSINGKPTITKLSGEVFKTFDELSDGDVDAVYAPIKYYTYESIYGDRTGSYASINCGSTGIKKISAKYGGWMDQLIVECNNGTSRKFGGSGGNTWGTIYPSSQPSAIKVNASTNFWGHLLEVRAIGTYDNYGGSLRMAGNTTTSYTNPTMIPCPAGYFVSGLRVNYDNYIQAIGPICRRK